MKRDEMAELQMSTSTKKPIVSVKFLAIVLGLAALVFVGAFGSIFLKEFWEQAAASKQATALKSEGERPSLPGVQGSGPSSPAGQEPEQGEKEPLTEGKPADEKPADEKPADEKPADEKP